MNISGSVHYLAIDPPIASIMQELTVPIMTYVELPSQSSEENILYISNKQANYIYTGFSGWLEIMTRSVTENYLSLSGDMLIGALVVNSSITLANANPIFLNNNNN